MDISAQKEEFSKAYVRAVTAVAGYAWSEPSVDDDSIDLTLSERGGGGSVRSPRVDLQLKCHAAAELTQLHLSYNLKIKNYDDLRDDGVLVPRILVVVIVPDYVADWANHSHTEMALRRSGYWLSLRGEPAITNTTKVALQVPRSQPFSPVELTSIMQRIGSGGMP